MPAHGAYPDPMDGRWHTSPQFDVAESTYRDGYCPAPVSMQDNPKIKLTDVTHTRQVVFAKEVGIWFVVDIMDAPPESEHTYTQMWHFHKDFPKDAVNPDIANQTIATAEAGKQNVFLYHASTTPLAYDKFHGEGWTGKGEMNSDTMPPTVRGWHNIAGGYGGKDIFPAVDVHASWKGKGRQVVLTALCPSRDAQSPVVSAERMAEAGRVGLRLKLQDGSQASCWAALGSESVVMNEIRSPASLLVLIKKPGSPNETGIVLGSYPAAADDTMSRELTIAGGIVKTSAPIGVPQGFAWEETPQGPRPLYGPSPALGGK